MSASTKRRSLSLKKGQIVIVNFGMKPSDFEENFEDALNILDTSERKTMLRKIVQPPLGVFPEIYKLRPAIVLSKIMGTVSVVPLSTYGTDKKCLAYEYDLPLGKYKGLSDTEISRVKGNSVTTVSLDRILLPRNTISKQLELEYLTPEDLRETIKALLNGLALGSLLKALSF